MSKVGKFLSRVNKGEVEKRKAKERQQEKLMELAVDAGMTYATRGTNKIGSGAAPKKAKGGEAKKDDKFIQKAVAEMEKKGTKGAFTKKANRRDMSVKQFTNEVLDNPSEYDLKTRRQAQFVANVTKYEWGGKVDTGVGVSDTLNKAYEYAKGGEIDLFEDYENMPENLSVIVEKYAEIDEMGEMDYAQTKNFLNEVQAIGYTFDYGLDNQPYDLRKMAKGGEIETKREFVEVVNQVKDENEAFPNDFVNVMDSINAILQDRGYEEDDEYTYDVRDEILDRYEKKVLEKQGLRFAKGGTMKKQGYDDKLDESLSMRKGKASTKKQSDKDRRDESKGMEKAMGKRAYASVGTMDKMAKGGQTQGYNDKLDESLGNRKGKESTKKQSLKDRRDESKGEEKALGKRAYSSVSSMDKLLPFLSWHKK